MAKKEKIDFKDKKKSSKKSKKKDKEKLTVEGYKGKSEGYPITKETDKAVMIDYFSGVEWVPKSQVEIKGGKVVKIKKWLRNKKHIPKISSSSYKKARKGELWRKIVYKKVKEVGGDYSASGKKRSKAEAVDKLAIIVTGKRKAKRSSNKMTQSEIIDILGKKRAMRIGKELKRKRTDLLGK